VHAGALDGLKFSNTAVFEQIGWTGLLVEGAPTNARALMRSGRRAKKFHLAVCPHGGHYVMMQGSDATATDLSRASDRFIQSWHGGHRDHGVPVACKPFGDMLHAAGLGAGVDLASIDVEGAELVVLETMDWDIEVRVWLVELDGSNETKDAAARRLLRANGYCRAPRFLDAFCGTGPPVVPRPSYLDCAVSEVFERCRPDLERLEARCPLDRNGRTCL